MKNGYYLSTYVHIDPLCYIENVVMRHDQNMCLWYWEKPDLKLIHYWELERETGLKQHSRSFYSIDQFNEIANELLSKYSLTLDDMVEVIGSNGIHTCHIDTYASYFDFPGIEYHCIAHLFSSLLMDTSMFSSEKILTLALDGGADQVLKVREKQKAFCGSYSEYGQLKKLIPLSSPAPLWGGASHLFNLKEGTLMALATACQCQAIIPETPLFPLDEVDCIHSDSSGFRKYLVWLNEYVWSLDMYDKTKFLTSFDERFTEEENRISVFMKEIIRKSLQIIEKDIDDIVKLCDIETENCCLSMSGGFALNCPINSYLIQKYKFKRLIAPPCVNDCGISLGYGLYYFWKYESGFSFHLQTAYYGDDDNGLFEILNASENRRYIDSIQTIDYEKAVDDLLKGPIVWFFGRSEIGPRALGNRSILADPRSEEMKNRLNSIKQRQWWRPVAPVILQEEASNWFVNMDESPFMLRTYQIIKEKEERIPAIAHLDNSARVQTVREQDNPDLVSLIRAFFNRTGVPMLCNTSLNDRGEPIINRINEALDFALKKRIDVVYINGMRIQLRIFEEFSMPVNNRRIDFDSAFETSDISSVRQKINPYKLDINALYFYFYTNLRDHFTLTDEKQADIIQKLSRNNQIEGWHG